ncbi:MAG: ferritin-like domain-containing protein [Actinomycetota bacterium]|nr:ferritin-like domain-containing protein [Actinomycetota bacterium]
MSRQRTIDLEDLGFDRGAHLLIAGALDELDAGDTLVVLGRDPALEMHLRAWCRRTGHGFVPPNEGLDPLPVDGRSAIAGLLIRGTARDARLVAAERAGTPQPAGIVSEAPAHWGLAARGALVEAGGPEVDFDLRERDLVWADAAPRLYAQAAANQWDPNAAIEWTADFELPPAVERAVVQVMTYLVENEQAALAVPARFLGRIHPHYREVVQFLAIQAADEARHVEVFTRRATLKGGELGLSGAGGRASLSTLLNEPSFTLAHFLLSVLGEGTFLNLLAFIERHAPDPVTRQVAHLALQDESRHVAFGMAHLIHRVEVEPALRSQLATAMRRRHDVLIDTAGLNEQVFDALVVLAAGAWSPQVIASGFAAVLQLQDDMDRGRRRRLRRLGFSLEEAEELSALHTRNFM